MSKMTFAQRLLAFQTALNGNSDVFAGEALESGKGKEKAKKGRANLAPDNDETPLVVIDTTVWGSVKDGFYITENYIHGKEFLQELHTFPIDSIRSIHVTESKFALTINGQTIAGSSEGIVPKLKIIAQCVLEHVNSVADAKDSIQEGLGPYLESLHKQLSVIQWSITSWSIRFSGDITKAVMKLSDFFTLGEESFFRRAAINIARNDALKSYDKLLLDAKDQINMLNSSIPISHANQMCVDYGKEPVELSFDFGVAIDKDTALSNDDWESNVQKSFDQLLECGEYLVQQVDTLMDRLMEIKREECDDDEEDD